MPLVPHHGETMIQRSHLMVGETTCDGKKKMFEILSEYQPVHVMEVPNKKNQVSLDLRLSEVAAFKGVVEKLTGNKITEGRLRRHGGTVNAQSAKLATLRQVDLP